MRKYMLVCVHSVLGNKSFEIGFKYGQDKLMSTGQIILIFGDME